MRRFVAVAILLSLSGCSSFWDDNEAKRVVEDSGFNDVEITGRRIFGCGRDDGYRVGFAATNAHGKRITGVVCGGVFFKSFTVRLD